MFGLAILFFLALWAVGTLLAMYLCGTVGGKLGAKVGLPLVGGLFGVALGFTLPMGRVFLGWAQEKIDAETTVAGLCATKAGIRIYISPEEHARRIRENDWEGVRRATIEDEVDGPYVFGKIITLDGKEFRASNKKMAGNYGKITDISEHPRKKYPHRAAYISHLYYDVVHQVPLFTVEAFMVGGGGGSSPNFKFWMPYQRGCLHAVENRRFQLMKRYHP